ncbi:MAG: hypothetical protein WAM62_13905 [Pseudolabrys sp.]|jgi:hypothetical protein
MTMQKYEFSLPRRALLTALVCVPVISSEAVTRQFCSLDSELIEIGAQFEHLTRTWDMVARQTNHTYNKFDIVGLIEFIDPIEATIVATRAKTLEGLLVKARAANWSREGRIYPEAEESTDLKMAWSIVRDLLDLSHSNLSNVE